MDSILAICQLHQFLDRAGLLYLAVPLLPVLIGALGHREPLGGLLLGPAQSHAPKAEFVAQCQTSLSSTAVGG